MPLAFRSSIINFLALEYLSMIILNKRSIKMLLTKFRDVLITRLKYLIILFNLYFGNLMSSLENIVESSWNFLKKKSLEIGLCASLLIGASGCGEDKRDKQIQKKEA